MRHAERLQRLDELLLAARDVWHPQPFRELRPAWCERWPALTAELLALSDRELLQLAEDNAAALARLRPCFPAIDEISHLAHLPRRASKLPLAGDGRWAWEIPGRKRQQIEAFAAVASASGQPVLDWCGGKGHLGRLLAWQWQVPVQTLEIDRQLCREGELLAGRLPLAHNFVPADALTAEAILHSGQQAVALHACGHLHRALIRHGAAAGVGRFDVAPCCYHLGVKGDYPAFNAHLQNRLSADDTRLAVTETVTASPRLQRQRDLEMAWKLGFSALRQETLGEPAYRSFKPVPAAWFRLGFAAFVQQMLARDGLVLPVIFNCAAYEAIGWQRQREVMRLSVLRSLFRRALEVWLALDLVVYLESTGYVADIGEFCARELTPRNLLISACR